MKTTFFQIAAHLKSTGSWTIHITPGQDDKLLVSVLFSDPASNNEGFNLVPVIFHETPAELDNCFFSKLVEPVKQANEVWADFADYHKSVQDAKKLIAEKAKAKTATAIAAPKADESALKKQRYDEALKQITELNSQCKYDQAIELLPAESDYPDKKAELEKLRTELENKRQQLLLL